MGAPSRIWAEIMARRRWELLVDPAEPLSARPACPEPLHRRWTIIKRQELNAERAQARHYRDAYFRLLEERERLRFAGQHAASAALMSAGHSIPDDEEDK